MESQKPFGIILIGYAYMVTAAILAIFYVHWFLIYPLLHSIDIFKTFILGLFIVIVPSIYHFVIARGILRLEPWSRKTLLWSIPILLLLSPVFVLMNGFAADRFTAALLVYGMFVYWIISISSFIYLIRPKAKEQFKQS